jgi:hypothetical protein
LEAAVDVLELLPDSDDSILKIDVHPPESEHFTSPHPVNQQEHESGIERVGRSWVHAVDGSAE